MGYQIIKQPDGRLALFSSYSDCWVAWDVTAEEVAEWFRCQSGPVDMEKVARYTELVLADRAVEAYSRTWVMTFAEAQAHSWHHGGEVLPGPVDQELLVTLEHPEDLQASDAVDAD